MKTTQFCLPKLVGLVLLISISIKNVFSANILTWQAIGSISTRISVTPLLNALADKGHNVTLLTIFDNMDGSDSKFKTVVPKKWKEAMGTSWEENHKFFDVRKNPLSVPQLSYEMMDYAVESCKVLYSDSEFVEWITSKETHFDLAILDSMANDCVYGLVSYFNAKMVIYSTTTVMPYMLDALGLPDETSSVGDMIFAFPSSHKNPMKFWQRFVNAWNPIIYQLRREWVYFPILEEITKKGLNLKENELPKFKDIEKNTSLVLLTTHFSTGVARSFPPNVVAVGGAVVTSKPKPLPSEIKEFIDSAKNGFIFVSFGTVAEFVNFDDEVQEEFISGLANFPNLKFVWKSSFPINKPLPDNILVTKWAPQQTLLAHPKIKAFISHAGMGSSTEAVHFGVPLVCIPVLADQDMIADSIVNREAGVKLEVLTLKREELVWAINEVLHNEKYQKGMKRLSAIFKDRPRTPTEEALWWVEYVLRHDNINEILTPPSAHQPWWKRRQIDVWVTSALILLTLALIPFYLLHFTVNKLLHVMFKSNTDSNNRLLKKVKKH